MTTFRRRSIFVALVLGIPLLGIPTKHLSAQVSDTITGYTAEECPPCAGWNAPHAPVHIYGNTYWVGTRGLGAILITSERGHVLIDGGLPESAPLVIDNIQALGFDVADVHLILNSHVHYDHAGGIATLQRVSGAEVVASPRSAPVLERGTLGRDDPQFGVGLPYPPVGGVRQIADGDRLHVGPLVVVAHFTPGHTPGGTSWSWTSCENGRCLGMVYADSETPVSADDFFYSRSEDYPTAVADFRRGFEVLEALRCDILLTPHPGASQLWQRVAARDEGDADALVDRGACRAYAEAARQQLDRRLEREAAGGS